MDMSGTFRVIYFLFSLDALILINAHTLSDVQRLKKSLFIDQEYDKFIRPVYDQTKVIEVRFYFYSILCFLVKSSFFCFWDCFHKVLGIILLL